MLLFGLLWISFLFLQQSYLHLLRLGASLYYQLSAAEFEFWLEGSLLFFRCYTPPALDARVEPEGIFANTVLLWTLVLATPGMDSRLRLKRWAQASGLLLVSQVVFLIAKIEMVLLAAGHPQAGSEAWWRFLDDFLETIGKGGVPIVIWLLLGFPYLMGRIEARKGGGPVGRNVPCPCGSGLKYKRCCGT